MDEVRYETINYDNYIDINFPKRWCSNLENSEKTIFLNQKASYLADNFGQYEVFLYILSD